MKKIIINVKDDIHLSSKSNIIATPIYIEFEDFTFPCTNWSDFSCDILGMWMHSMIENQYISNTKFTLCFLDGPYKMIAKKDEKMQLTIDCIDSHNQDICIFTFKCFYIDFLVALYNAFKSLNYILYKNNLFEGKYKEVYNQTIISANELKAMISNFSII